MRGARVLAVLVFLALTGPGAAGAGPVFVLTGKGWGHGIGMSQHGAQGFALQGWKYDAILEHYYTGATVTGGFANDTVRVLLASERASLSLASDAPFEVAGVALAAGTYTVRAGTGQIRLTRSGTTTTVASPATATPGAAALELGGVAYRGSIVLAARTSGTAVSALNVLRRQAYIQGVVPREMPSSWQTEALKAQAVAARTYSLATGGHCVWPPSQQVFCPDTRDQVYGGKSAETVATNAAVTATAGDVVTYDGSPIAAYFSSTSGGRTAAKADEWGPPAIPYLVSVLDPHDGISPHHAWGPKDAEIDCTGTSPDCVFTAGQARTRLGLAELPRDLRVTARNGSSRVATLEATGPAASASFTGTAARTKLGLRSTWFYVGVLSLERSAATITYGSVVTASGLARRGNTSGWGVATLERRRAGETAWSKVGDPLPNGEWARTLRPRRTADFRVVSGNATGEAARVSVRTRVAFHPPKSPFTRLRGFVRPAGKGVLVTLSRKRTDGTWIVVAHVGTAADGSFAFTVSRRGTYRARADAGAGLLPGSAVVTLPPP